MELLTPDMMMPQRRRGLTTGIPLIDVVFLLLIFFMTASVRRTGTELALKAPEAAGQAGGPVLEDDRLRRVDVRVTSVDGAVRYEVDDLGTNGREELVARLKDLKGRSQRPLLVAIDDAPGARHGDVVRVFDVCRQLGVENVTLIGK